MPQDCLVNELQHPVGSLRSGSEQRPCGHGATSIPLRRDHHLQSAHHRCIVCWPLDAQPARIVTFASAVTRRISVLCQASSRTHGPGMLPAGCTVEHQCGNSILINVAYAGPGAHQTSADNMLVMAANSTHLAIWAEQQSGSDTPSFSCAAGTLCCPGRGCLPLLHVSLQCRSHVMHCSALDALLRHSCRRILSGSGSSIRAVSDAWAVLCSVIVKSCAGCLFCGPSKPAVPRRALMKACQAGKRRPAVVEVSHRQLGSLHCRCSVCPPLSLETQCVAQCRPLKMGLLWLALSLWRHAQLLAGACIHPACSLGKPLASAKQAQSACRCSQLRRQRHAPADSARNKPP